MLLQSFSELVRPHVIKPRHIKSLLTTVTLMLVSSSLPRTVSSSYYVTLRRPLCDIVDTGTPIRHSLCSSRTLQSAYHGGRLVRL